MVHGGAAPQVKATASAWSQKSFRGPPPVEERLSPRADTYAGGPESNHNIAHLSAER